MTYLLMALAALVVAYIATFVIEARQRRRRKSLRELQKFDEMQRQQAKFYTQKLRDELREKHDRDWFAAGGTRD